MGQGYIHILVLEAPRRAGAARPRAGSGPTLRPSGGQPNCVTRDSKALSTVALADLYLQLIYSLWTVDATNLASRLERCHSSVHELSDVDVDVDTWTRG